MALSDEPPTENDACLENCTEVIVGEQPRAVTDLTRGIRVAGAHAALAQAPSDPNVVYMGTQHGRLNVSRDGGQSWEESTVLTSRGRFLGAIRPASPPPGLLTRWLTLSPVSLGRAAGIGLPSRLMRLNSGDGGQVGTNTSSDLNPGDPLVGNLTGLESARNSTAAGALRGTHSQLVFPVDGGGGGGGGGGGNSLAVGLKARAPWLAYQVRRKRGWAIGMSLKQSLVLKVGAGTGVWHLAVHPTDSNDVLAATSDGLRRSRDGGYSWPLILTGTNSRERSINHVVRDPLNPRLIYAATRAGVRVSRDDGNSFEKMLNRFVSGSDSRWIEMNARRPGLMYVGRSSGLVRSADGGRSFRLVHRSPWPALAKIRQVRIDPSDTQRVWLGTEDGLLVSRDDGLSYRRVGGLLFVGQDVKKIVFGNQVGHIMVATYRDLWESFDAGETWRAAYFGPIHWDIRNIIADRSRPNSFLIATSQEILRFGPQDSQSADASRVRQYREFVAQEPTLMKVLKLALVRAGLHRPDIMKYRSRARSRGLMPRVTSAVRWAQFDFDRNLTNQIYQDDPLNERGSVAQPFMGVVFAQWDLKKLIFTSDESIARRVARQNLAGEAQLQFTVISMYQERRRLLLESLTQTSSPRMELYRNLRLEELTAHLNALAGDVFEPIEAL